MTVEMPSRLEPSRATAIESFIEKTGKAAGAGE